MPAAKIEAAVVEQLRGMLRSPEIIVATWRAARSEIAGLSKDTVREALERLDPLWEELFPPSRLVSSSFWSSEWTSGSLDSTYTSGHMA